MTRRIPNPDGVPPGNTILVGLKFSSSLGSLAGGLKVRDDKGNTYTGVDGGWDGSAMGCALFRSINVKGRVRRVFIDNVSGDNMTDFMVSIVDIPDIASFDLANKATGSGTAMTGGALAVGATGRFIIQFSWRVGSGADHTTTLTPTTHANIVWTNDNENTNEGHCVQSGVYNSASSITPQCDAGTTTTGWITVSAAFVVGDSGRGVPPGLFVRGLHHVGILNPNPTPVHIRHTFKGNLGLVMNSGGVPTHALVTAISGTNNWSRETPIAQNDANNIMMWAPVTTAVDDMTLTLNDGLGDLTHMLCDIAGADSIAPKVFYDHVTGNQSVTAPITTFTRAPSAVGNMTFSQVSWASGTADDLLDQQMVFYSDNWDGEPVDGPTNGDENNGFGMHLAQDTNRHDWTFHRTAASIGAGNWEATIIEFKAAPIVGASVPLALPQWPSRLGA
ncbi:MAG TPA: hypothetical protein VE008_07295 [Burkholderiales bacterium]|nr:hypothetical protein [Burkholderiales bacterium]